MPDEQPPSPLPRGRPKPRQHHVVPASYLAAFSADGTQDGRIHVWSRTQRRVWPSTPRKAGKERDFYRIDKEGVDPQAAEDALGEVESAAGPVIRQIIASGRLPPDEDDFHLVLLFVALLEARGRSMRALLEENMAREARILLQLTLTNPEIWERRKRQIIAEGFDPARIPEPFELLDAIRTGRIRITVPQNGKVTWVGQMLAIVFPLLQQRHWAVLRPPPVDTEFVTGDRPLVLATTEPEPPSPYGIALGGVGTDVSVALDPRTLLLGRYGEFEPPTCDAPFVAMMNSRVVNRSHREFYSRGEDCFVLGPGERLLSLRSVLPSSDTAPG